MDAGNELLDCLRAKRREVSLGLLFIAMRSFRVSNIYQDPRRPLVLVGHSLGGLLIKQALVNAHDNSHYSDIELSVYGGPFQVLFSLVSDIQLARALFSLELPMKVATKPPQRSDSASQQPRLRSPLVSTPTTQLYKHSLRAQPLGAF